MLQAPDSPHKPAVRIHYLDWLRALAVLAVVAFHAELPFGVNLGTWPIQNVPASETLGRVNSVIMFLFPVFFLLAGASAQLALRTRTIRAFLLERTTRLVVPFVLGTVLLVLPTLYLLATYTGATHGSFPEYVGTWASTRFDAIRSWGFSPMAFSIGDWLWFLAWLFVFAVLATPIFTLLSSPRGHALVGWIARFARWPGATLLFVVPIAIVSLPLFRISPADQWQGWWAFGIYLAMFVVGYVIYCDERLVAAIRRDLIPAVVASALALYGIAATGFTASIFAGGAHTSDLYYVFIVFLHALIGWAPALVVLSFGMWLPLLRRPLPAAVGEAVLPTYILHMPIVFAISAFVVAWSLDIWAKAAATVILGVAISVAVAAVAVRIPGVRSLLGVRHRIRRSASAAPRIARRATPLRPRPS